MDDVRRRKKSLKEMSPRERALTLTAIVVSLVVISAAERDIQRRSDAEVNGSRWLWRLVSLNALGALSYFRWGRRGSVR
jgi:hypothetical protein